MSLIGRQNSNGHVSRRVHPLTVCNYSYCVDEAKQSRGRTDRCNVPGATCPQRALLGWVCHCLESVPFRSGLFAIVPIKPPIPTF